MEYNAPTITVVLHWENLFQHPKSLLQTSTIAPPYSNRSGTFFSVADVASLAIFHINLDDEATYKKAPNLTRDA